MVYTPRVRARGSVDERTHLDVAYAADIWTSASIDVRTAATRTVSEQRDELDLALDHEMDDLTLALSYRFSNEEDYVSHTFGAAADLDLADGNATLSLSASFGYDFIGRSADVELPFQLLTPGLRFSFTQVIDSQTLAQATYEVSNPNGFQSNVYRFVGIGGTGICRAGATLCIPEVHPDVRVRHAGALRVQRALGDHASIGVAYRFYNDSWQLMAHTFRADAAWLPDEESVFRLRYRAYVQSRAAFYHSSYRMEDLAQQSFFTRDRELGAMSSHRLRLSYERDVQIVGAGPPLRLTLSVAGTRFDYGDFRGLEQVLAVDVVVGALWEL